MNITAKTKLCMIIGDPVEHSLSPQMHNSAYEALGMDNEFVYVACHVTAEKLVDAINGVRAMNVHGITVTIPHKESVIPLLDSVDDMAKKIGAVNTIVNREGKLQGSNTDWIGVVEALETKTSLANKSVAIIGAGGAARAAVYGVTSKGAKVTIFNRTLEKAEEIAKDFGCSAKSLSELAMIKDMDIIINLTSVGLESNTSLIDSNFLQSHHIVMDAVYVPYETKLLRDAKEKDATIIHGTDWLLYQGFAQFEIFTGKKAPEEIMRKIVMDNVTK